KRAAEELSQKKKALAAAQSTGDRAARAAARAAEARARAAHTAAARERTRTDRALTRAIARIQKFQEADFLGIFRVTDGLPVTIRTLDPHLHEFLPHANALHPALAALAALRAA